MIATGAPGPLPVRGGVHCRLMDLAGYVEHTLLAADATAERVERLCREATVHGLLGVCVAPVHVALARTAVASSPVRVVTVAGFPLGSSTSVVKAEEARRAVEDGADEVDMVVAIGAAKSGRLDAVLADVREVRAAIPGRVLKVILETGYFDEAELRALALAVLDGGADFLKTCTGFGPRGATVSDVRLLAGIAEGRAGVKASGGIRTRQAALDMIAAGATRIGTSNGVELTVAR